MAGYASNYRPQAKEQEMPGRFTARDAVAFPAVVVE
jgi:hypothetical protein